MSPITHPDAAVLRDLDARFPARKQQIRTLELLLSPRLPTPSAVVVHGPSCTGKTSISSALLVAFNVPHAIVNSAECITGRHFLERTLSSVSDAISAEDGEEADETAVGGRCESMSVLAVKLQALLSQREGRFVLVFDGIDRQREAPGTLLQGLARLGEMIPRLATVFIVTSPRPRFLHVTGAPHVTFPAYDKVQCVAIVCARRPPPRIFEPPQPPSSPVSNSPPSPVEESDDAEESLWVYSRFASVVYDTLARGAARDLGGFRAACDALWRPFVAPIADGSYGTRDFSKLLVAQRALFQDESVLVGGIVRERGSAGTKNEHDLPYYSKFLLCAAYLASYNPARQDALWFMKAAAERKRRRKQSGAGRGGKHRKIQRRLLGPQAFPLERLLAIFHAILPVPAPTTADIPTQIATLCSLRLLTRSSTTADVLEGLTKWRVNVGWEYIRSLARGVGFEIESQLAE
ncbi:MAG: hypothetical protein M1832_002562 [Thelocarpon impressellum]|nr:MAG: hypothetical protein M1832_002562 [Thelocarpon impressellum]